jgi:hypothetical protein
MKVTLGKRIQFKYEWQTTKNGLAFTIILIIILLIVMFLPLCIAQPNMITFSLVAICIFVLLFISNELYITIKAAPKIIEIENNILRGIYYSGHIVEIPLYKIDEIIEKKRSWLWSQFSIYLRSNSEKKEILLGKYLINIQILIHLIKMANPSLKITSKW